MKGKSAIHIARGYQKKNYVGIHFGARGYYVSTVGTDEEVVHAVWISARHRVRTYHELQTVRVRWVILRGCPAMAVRFWRWCWCCQESYRMVSVTSGIDERICPALALIPASCASARIRSRRASSDSCLSMNRPSFSVRASILPAVLNSWRNGQVIHVRISP